MKTCWKPQERTSVSAAEVGGFILLLLKLLTQVRLCLGMLLGLYGLVLACSI